MDSRRLLPGPRLLVAVSLLAAACNQDLVPGVDAGLPDQALAVPDEDLAGPAPDLAPGPTCSDGVRNQDETDVDCGGATCPACMLGQRCVRGRDCASRFCDDHACARRGIWFAGSIDTVVPRAPAGFALGDLDEDGILDVVLPTPGWLPDWNAATPQLTVLRGRGNARYDRLQAAKLLPAGAAVAVGDLNHDGHLDVVLLRNPQQGNYDSVVTLLVGDGKGGLRKSDERNVPGYAASLLAVGDVTGDGRPDVLTTVGDDLVLLAGGGDGTLRDPVRTATAPSPKGLALGDLDGDGLLDVVVAGSGLNVHAGGRTPGVSRPEYGGAGVTSIALGDLDGDGRLDAAITTYQGAALAVLQGDGHGGLFERWDRPAADAYSYGVALGDLDGDGVLDLVSDDFYTVSVRRGLGGGQFATAVELPGLRQPVVADLDADGKPDLAGLVGPGFSVYPGHGDGTLAGPAWGPSNLDSAAAADLDGDGKLDLVGVDRKSDPNAVLFVRGQGTSLAAPVSAFSQPKVGFSALVTADFNGDRDVDVALGGGGYNVGVVLGFGDGRLGKGGGYQEYFAGNCALNMVAGDFDGDGRADVACAHDDAINVLLGNGDGTFSAMEPARFTCGGLNTVSAADLDGDGTTDLALACTDGAWVKRMVPGHWQDAPLLAAPGATLTVLLADLTGDKKVDLALVPDDAAMGRLLVRVGDGGGGLAPPVTSPLALADYLYQPLLLAGSVDHDGVIDLVFQSSTFTPKGWGLSGVVLPGAGGGSFRDAGAFGHAVPSGRGSLVLGDFDRDGWTDIALAGSGAMLLLNQTGK